MPQKLKNKYEKKHDQVILEALNQSPDNRNEAFRIAEKELKDKFNMKVNANQISSRFYTYIKPNYFPPRENGNKKENGELKNQLITSAGSGISGHGKHYELVRELVLRLTSEERTDMIKDIFDSLAD